MHFPKLIHRDGTDSIHMYPLLSSYVGVLKIWLKNLGPIRLME
jgi:hypothetical protein